MREAATNMSSRSLRSRRVLWVMLAATAVLLAGCGNEAGLPQNALDPEGPVARQLHRLWNPVAGIAAVIFVLVEALIVYVIIKFRAKSDDDQPVQVHGNTKLEITWTIIPAAILAVVGFFTVFTVFDITKAASGPDVVRVEVTGHQWWWEYEYPEEEIVTANELHIPIGRTVELKMTSADVIHSFWPPKLAGKVDTIPGRINTMTLEAEKPGTYFGQCAEYCGLSHANMRLQVIAHTQADYDRWVAGQKRDAPRATAGTAAAAGEQLFIQRGCNGCHSISGLPQANGKIGPNLTHLYSRKVFAGAIFDLTDANMRKWLRNPPAEKPMMPDDGMGMPDLGLSEEDITNLMAYLKTLK
jgi:cytochrome c oxidase subunit II